MQYDYPPALRAVQDKVEEKLGVKFNHVMLNLYEDGKGEFRFSLFCSLVARSEQNTDTSGRE